MINTYLSTNVGCRILIQKKNIILGITKNYSAENLITLQLKYYIYRMRCANKDISVLGAILSFKQLIESYKFIASKDNELNKFNEYWGQWLPILNI